MTDLLATEGNLVLLRRGLALLDALSDAEYADPRGRWAPVGAQYRHVLDHYASWIQGLPEGRVDYDDRSRDPRLESDRGFARSRTLECLDALAGLEAHPDRPVLVQMHCGGEDPAPDWRESSAGRELQFLCSHTVHHFALIQLLLEGSGVTLDPEFGTAPSTLAWQRSTR